jgi:hypothetical protein
MTAADVAPSILSFSPVSGPEGALVTITGENFSPVTADNEVYFNGIAAFVKSSSLNEITANVPFFATTGRITVMVKGRSALSLTDFVVCTVPAKPRISMEGALLISDSDTGNQWYRNGAPIAGATNKSYEAKDAGSYTVSVTVDGCSSLSDASTITGIEGNTRRLISVYPNPTSESLAIELDFDSSITAAELYSVLGIKKETIAFVVEGSSLVAKINMTHYPSGLYLVFVRSRKGDVVVKVMKE